MYTSDQIKRGIKDPRLVGNHLSNKWQEHVATPILNHLNNPNNGIYVMEQDWDNLVILDTCRYDIFKRVNTISGDLKKRMSRGSATPEFITENFKQDKYHDTIWISANAVVGSYSDVIDVYKLIGLWGKNDSNSQVQYPNDNTHPLSLTDPEPVVDKALEVQREYPNKRHIIHFLQPHTPYLVKDGEKLPKDSKYRTFSGARRGDVSADEIRDVYIENLEYVLEYVETLVTQLDGKTIITADHGELLGEGVPLHYRLLDNRWSIRNLDHYDFAHYNRMHVPELTKVPWLETDSSDSRREIESSEQPAGVEMDEDAIEEQLAALGYKSK